MKKLKSFLNVNKFLKLYILSFSLINGAYVFFAGAKSNYIDTNSLTGTIEKNQFEYLSNISKITNFLEVSMLLILLIYLAKVIIKKDKNDMKGFLIIHFILFTVFFFINYLVSVFSPAYFWPSSKLLFIPVQIISIVFICFAVSSIYKKLFRTSN